MQIPHSFRRWPVTIVVLIVIAAVVLISYFTLLGQRTEAVFSDVDMGLTGESAPAPPQAPAARSDYASEMPMESESQNGQVANQPALERLVIKNANLSLQVKDVRTSEAAVTALATQLQGYVVQVQTSGTEGNVSSSITFRVPADKFDQALTSLQEMAEAVFSRTVTGDDVTEEFVDLESRLRNLEATRTRLLALMDRADAVEDALSVSTALTDIQGQIEQIQGRMQYLQQSAALSTVTVSLWSEPVIPIVDQDAWQPLEVAAEALRGLLALGQGLINLVIVLLVWLPAWLPLLLLGRWLWLKYQRRPHAGGQETATTPESV